MIVATITAILPLVLFAAEQPKFDPGSEIRLTVRLLEQHHLSHKCVDDAVAQQWLDRFIDELDPKHAYFLTADVEEFRRSTDRLDDDARKGDFSFALAVRKRYRQRVKSATNIAREWLKQPHDFTVDEEFTLHHDGFAADEEALNERWRLRIKAELLAEKLHGVPLEEAREQLEARYRRIERQARELNDERLCEFYLHALTSVYDPGSIYLSPETLSWFSQTISFDNFTLGLHWRRIRGNSRIAGVDAARARPSELPKFLGWDLLAIRQIDGTVHDLVEIHDSNFIWHPVGPLRGDTEIFLELQHPFTLERQTVLWQRISY